MAMNEQEVMKLREDIFADGKVTKEEVIKIWASKDEQGVGSLGEFDELFVEVVMAWLQADGKIDEEEAQFLINKINEDGDIDFNEENLLEAINDFRLEGNEIPASLMEAFLGYFEDPEEGVETEE